MDDVVGQLRWRAHGRRARDGGGGFVAAAAGWQSRRLGCGGGGGDGGAEADESYGRCGRYGCGGVG